MNLHRFIGKRNIGDGAGERSAGATISIATISRCSTSSGPAFVAALERCRATRRPSTAVAAPSLDAPLSPREAEVARLAIAGRGDKEIARRLGLSVTTVRTHVKHVYEKLTSTAASRSPRLA